VVFATSQDELVVNFASQPIAELFSYFFAVFCKFLPFTPTDVGEQEPSTHGASPASN
jgi:hypothetical protein